MEEETRSGLENMDIVTDISDDESLHSLPKTREEENLEEFVFGHDLDFVTQAGSDGNFDTGNSLNQDKDFESTDQDTTGLDHLDDAEASKKFTCSDYVNASSRLIISSSCFS